MVADRPRPAPAGTLGAFLLDLSALRHLPATRVGVVATLEPPLATVMAWAIHGEAPAAVQIAGGLLVVAAVAWTQLHPPAPEVEAVPGCVRPAQEGAASGR